MTNSPHQSEPDWLRDWRLFCENYRKETAGRPLTRGQRETAWRVFCDRLEQERVRRLFSPKQGNGDRDGTRLPLLPPKDEN